MLRLQYKTPIYKDIPPEYFVADLERMLMLADFESIGGNVRECYRYYCYSIFGYCGGWYNPETRLAYPADVTDDKLGFRQRLVC